MSGRRKEIAPERVAEARRLYENTLTPVREIATMMGLSRNTLDNRIAEWKWRRRYYIRDGAITAAAPRDDAAAAASETVLPQAETGTSLAAANGLPANFAVRLQRVIDVEFDVAERILRTLNPADSAEAERTARTFAVVSRVVNEIKANALSAGPTPPDETDHDPVPRDIDEFRLALARRIRGFIEAQQNGADQVLDAGEAELG